MAWCSSTGDASIPFGPLPAIHNVVAGCIHASPSWLRFRDPSAFVAGGLHQHVPFWSTILEGSSKQAEILSYIRDGVDVHSFFQPFRGRYQNNDYDHPIPPSVVFKNNASYKGFEDFITSTILSRVHNGSLVALGKVGEVPPPHLVMPLTVEPSKPRLCHDERCLNLWIKDLPFSLDKITDLPRYVGKDHYQTVLDGKSGYDHVLLTDPSQTFSGLQWSGWYFCFRTIPFGWKTSAYLYHIIGLTATSYARSLGVPSSQYIDDRHLGQLQIQRNSRGRFPPPSQFILAQSAAYIMCYILIHLGYFIGLKKSILIPRLVVPFLGLLVDSSNQAFFLPDDKKKKFILLRDSILKKKTVSLKTLQKFAGKIMSFTLVVPGARLYTSAIYQAISKLHGKTRSIPLKDVLLREIQSWEFFDTWTGYLPWRQEYHFQLSLSSDASNTGWGGVINFPDQPSETVTGIWDYSERSSHTVDLMALPANVMPDQSGNPLKFFSPFPTVQAAGANVFSQTITSENAYVFPPICASRSTPQISANPKLLIFYRGTRSHT